MLNVKTNKKFVHRNVLDEAILGMKEVLPHVEHIRDSGAKELLDRNIMNLKVADKVVVDRNSAGLDVSRGNVGESNIAVKNLPIIVRRNSYNIVGATLPFVLFCPVAIVENYNSVFNFTQTMPAGITCTVSYFQNRFMRFTYVETATLLSDTIDVFTDFAVGYPIINEMQREDAFSSKFVKLTVGTGNTDLQFNSSAVHWGRLTFGGVVDTDSNPPAMYKRTEQFQTAIINFDVTLNVNGRRYLVWSMASSIVNPGDATIRMDFFLDQYESAVDFDGATGCTN